MKIYLDSADVNSWQLPDGCPPLQGVTTNPSLIQHAGLSVSLTTYLHLIDKAGQVGLPELMLQLPYNDPVEARTWLNAINASSETLDVVITIKLPCHPNWTPTIREVQRHQNKVLLTGLSNPMQLLWAQAQKADYVAPYLGRLHDDKRDVMALMRACVALEAGGPKLLAASIRNESVFSELIGLRAYAVTLRPEFLKALCTDPITDQAILAFASDTAQSLSLAP